MRQWISPQSEVQAGTDVDPLTVKAARDNAKLNGVDSRLTVVQCEASLHVSP